MSTVQTVSQATAMLNVAELDVLIRRAVREEITRALKVWGFYEEPTIIEPGSPIHQDLLETLRMAEAGTLRILSREEALSAG